MREFPIGQLSTTVLQDACRFIAQHSTVFVHPDDILGSGTFVTVAGHHGILTAYHVPHNARQPFNFGPDSTDRFGIAVETIAHAFWLEARYVIPHIIGKPVQEEYGPDLMFLEIPQSPELETIKAKRSFWNLSFQAEERSSACYSDTNCLWSLSGHPGEWKKNEPPEHGFSIVHGYPNLIGFTGVENRCEKYGFDYFEVAVDYRSGNALPGTFGGCSGGGLWRVPISLPREDAPLTQLQTGAPILSGVVFYQTAVQERRRFIRSHGSKSIYDVLPRKLEEGQQHL